MAAMSEVKAVVRTGCLPELLDALERAEVARLYVTHVHALGAGVDPEEYKLSLDDGRTYTEKAKIEFLCRTESVERIVDVIREWACTGHRGDGLVIVSDVRDVVNVRTGDRGDIALM